MRSLLAISQSAKHAVRALRGQDLWQGTQTDCEKVWLGNEAPRWCFCPGGLNASSTVYSCGVGEDISFDLELIHRFGVRVHAFDPTPRSIAWVQKQSLPTEFVFHKFGTADFDGRCKFVPPENPGHVSHTLLARKSPWPPVEVEVRRVRTMMDTLGHNHIDLLKMDIEGAEYGVLSDLLDCRIPVKQLLVEFHHRWANMGVERTRQAIGQLNAAGFVIFNFSPSGEEYSFLEAQAI